MSPADLQREAIMVISGRRIKNLSRHFAGIKEGAKVVLAVDVSDVPKDPLGRVGFPHEFRDAASRSAPRDEGGR